VENLSSAFYEKLHRQYPGLSKTDIKICSYIRLNLSNAQIAQLQNIEPSSLKVSRHRLRKKLNLGPDDDLDAFLGAL
jgi:DNA-binding CsgD family transcriptional regulator